jgi:hypothetical protein
MEHAKKRSYQKILHLNDCQKKRRLSMKKLFKRCISAALVCVMVIAMSAIGASATTGATATTSKTVSVTVHTVVRGDSIHSLAKKYLGSANKWKEIYNANPATASDPNKFYVSQKLVIPTAPSSTTATTTPTVTTAKVDKSTRPRVIVTTDLEVDDMNGILLTLMYCSDFDLAGIVWTAGRFHFSGDGKHTLQEAVDLWYPGYKISCDATTAGGTVSKPGELTSFRPVDPTWLKRVVNDYYRADYKLLSKNNPNYPTPDYLLSVAKVGNIAFEGDFHADTEGSNLIKACILDDDTRPLTIQHWGGINTTVRALVSIYEEYHDTKQWPEIQAKVVKKIRLNGNGEDNCRAYSKIDEMFPGLKSSNRVSFGGYVNGYGAVEAGTHGLPSFFGSSKLLLPYYQSEFLTEAFKFNHGRVLGHFYLMNDGQVIYGEPMINQYGLLNCVDWSTANKQGWAAPTIAGIPVSNYSNIILDDYDWMCSQFGTASFVDIGIRQAAASREEHYGEVLFQELAARADWAVFAPQNCNHAPVVSVKDMDVTAKAGETLNLVGIAADPDGNTMNVTWWVANSACTYKGAPIKGNAPVWAISNPNVLSTKFTVPADAKAGDVIVVNLEVKDVAERPMTRFAQVIINVKG